MPSLTNYGQIVALFDDDRTILPGLTAGTPATQGGIAHIADAVGLFDGTSTEDKAADTANWVAPTGGGYTGDVTITKDGAAPNWGTPTVASGDVTMTLANNVWTAGAGGMAAVGGANIQDEEGNVLAWWERSSDIALALNDTITADQLSIRIV